MAYVTEEFQDLATETGWVSGTITAAYNVVLDQSLRQLGYAESALSTADVPQVSILGYMALLDFYALSRYAKFFAVQMDIAVAPAISAKRSQVGMAVQSLLKDARARCIQLGVGPVEQLVEGRFTLDFLEPSIGEF